MKKIVATASALLLLAACSDTESETPASPATATTEAPSPEPTTDEPAISSEPEPSETEEPTGDGEATSESEATEAPVEKPADDIAWMTGPQQNDIFPNLTDPILVPTAQRFGLHESSERIVIDYEGEAELGWSAEYTTTPVYEGSGNPVDLGGQTYLVIYVSGAMVDMADQSTWEFPTAGAPGSAFITGIETTGGFEGMQEIYIGLDKERPYHVSQLSDPHRLVIDIQK